MRERILAGFGGPLERVERALAAIAAGRGVLVTDDERRENEGDIIFAAESITEAQMAMLIREGSGIVCLCLTPEKVRESRPADDGREEFQPLRHCLHGDHRGSRGRNDGCLRP